MIELQFNVTDLEFKVTDLEGNPVAIGGAVQDLQVQELAKKAQVRDQIPWRRAEFLPTPALVAQEQGPTVPPLCLEFR